MRLLSRPLGVVRIRWGICRRAWCGCGVIAQSHGRVAAEVIDGPRVENSRIRRHNTPPPTPDYEEPPFLPSSRMQRPGLFGLRDVHRWNLRGLPIQPLLSIALVLHAQRPAAPRRGGGAWSARSTRRHGHSRHPSTGTLAATGTHLTPQRTHSPPRAHLPPRALTSPLNGRTRHHGHSRHASTGTLAATGTHVTPPRALTSPLNVHTRRRGRTRFTGS